MYCGWASRTPGLATKLKNNNQYCGAGAGAARSRSFWPELKLVFASFSSGSLLAPGLTKVVHFIIIHLEQDQASDLNPEVGTRKFFLSPQSQFRNLKEALPQSQFRNFSRNLAPQPQLRNSAIAIFSEVQNFKSATLELHFRNFRHIFGHEVAKNYIFF